MADTKVRIFPADLDARTQYKMVKSPEVKKMSDADGSVLEVKAWLQYTEIDSATGETKEVLTILTADGEMFGTISGVFQKEFNDIVELFGEDVGAIKVFSGKSRAGRTFITCSIE